MTDAKYEKIADNAKLKAIHQIMTVVGFPLVFAVSGFAGVQLWAMNAAMARFDDIARRVGVIEEYQRDQYSHLLNRPRFDASDGQRLESKLSKRIDKNADNIARNTEAVFSLKARAN